MALMPWYLSMNFSCFQGTINCFLKLVLNVLHDKYEIKQTGLDHSKC